MLRVAVGGVFLPLTLSVGLLASPVVCQCGSALPHDHSLFTLGNHTHAPGERESDDHRYVSKQDDSAMVDSSNAAEARVDGPTLRAATDYAAGQPRAIYLVASVVTSDTVGPPGHVLAERPADGRPIAPERPPPRA
ncbi:MAG TPA: hypothetical protein VMM78_05500 [Thermomicrobiales bacterium]|nr:hypothetical protein [Thermomicrobiales bacterium]